MIYVSIASVPDRQDTIITVLSNILNQSVKPDKIILNLCERYDRFPGAVYSIDIVNKIENLSDDVYINWTIDKGPATKFLGFFEHMLPKIRENDKVIIFDDDVFHHRESIELLSGQLVDDIVVAFSYHGFIGYDQMTTPVRPNLPGYLGFCFYGKHCNNLNDFFITCIDKYQDCKYDDDAIATRFMRKNNIRLLWIECPQSEHLKFSSALCEQSDCAHKRQLICNFLSTM